MPSTPGNRRPGSVNAKSKEAAIGGDGLDLGGDAEGYNAALRMGLQLFEMGKRRSGRTTHMIDMFRDGGVIICGDARV